MKKVSTVVTKQSRNISQPTLTIGLDLGDRNSWYCVLDETGEIQLEQRVRTNAKALQEVFGDMPRSRIALEIGTHSPWISRVLIDLGHYRQSGQEGPASRKSAGRLGQPPLGELRKHGPAPKSGFG